MVHFLKTMLDSCLVGRSIWRRQDAHFCRSSTVTAPHFHKGVVCVFSLISWMDGDEEQTCLMFKINVQILNEWDRPINRVLMSILFPLNLKSNIYFLERIPTRKSCWLRQPRSPLCLLWCSGLAQGRLRSGVCLTAQSSHRLFAFWTRQFSSLCFWQLEYQGCFSGKVLLHLRHGFKVMITVLTFLFSS